MGKNVAKKPQVEIVYCKPGVWKRGLKKGQQLLHRNGKTGALTPPYGARFELETDVRRALLRGDLVPTTKDEVAAGAKAKADAAAEEAADARKAADKAAKAKADKKAGASPAADSDEAADEPVVVEAPPKAPAKPAASKSKS